MNRIGPNLQPNFAVAPAAAAPADVEATLERVMTESMAGAMQIAQDRAAKLPAGTPATISVAVEVTVGPDGQVTVDEQIDVRPGAAVARQAPQAPVQLPGGLPGLDAGEPVVLRPG